MTKLLKSPVVVNAALFQAVWFACVLGSAYGLLWPALLSCGLLMVWQLHPKRRHPSDIKLVVAAMILGFTVDTIWIQAGLMEFTEQRFIDGIAPLWIVSLWMGFALTINHSLVWLFAHPTLPALMGLIGGPMSYLAGLKFGAVEYLDDPLLISACLGLAWAVSMIILVRIAGPKQLKPLKLSSFRTQ